MLPTSTDVSIDVKTRFPADADAIVVFATEGKSAPAVSALSNRQRAAVDRLFAGGVVRGKAKELAFDLVENGKAKTSRIFVVGLGRAEKVTAETLRQAGGQLARALRKHRMKRVALITPAIAKVEATVA